MSTEVLSTEEGNDALLVSISPNGLYLAYVTPLDGVFTLLVVDIASKSVLRRIESDASEFNELFWGEGFPFVSVSSSRGSVAVSAGPRRGSDSLRRRHSG